MLTVIVLVKALVEVAGLALLGQGLVYVLAGAGREQNVFYRVLKIIASPVVKITRWITPKFISDGQIPFLAFVLVAGLWIGLTLEKVAQCAEQPQHPACGGRVQSQPGEPGG